MQPRHKRILRIGGIIAVLAMFSVAGCVWREHRDPQSRESILVFVGVMMVLILNEATVRILHLRPHQPVPSKVRPQSAWRGRLNDAAFELVAMLGPSVAALTAIIATVFGGMTLDSILSRAMPTARTWIGVTRIIPSEWHLAVLIVLGGAFGLVSFAIVRRLCARAAAFRNLERARCPMCAYPLAITADGDAVRIGKCTECGWTLSREAKNVDIPA